MLKDLTGDGSRGLFKSVKTGFETVEKMLKIKIIKIKRANTPKTLIFDESTRVMNEEPLIRTKLKLDVRFDSKYENKI